FPVVLERLHLLCELEQDVLRHVLGVGLLEVPLPAPGVDLAAVALRELGPGLLVGRNLPELRQEGDAGLRLHGPPPSSSLLRSRILRGGARPRQAQIRRALPSAGSEKPGTRR